MICSGIEGDIPSVVVCYTTAGASYGISETLDAGEVVHVVAIVVRHGLLDKVGELVDEDSPDLEDGVVVVNIALGYGLEIA